ncbi:MAG: GNAT family N-acetyltransferase [Acetobacteraceae bacterium]|nr:GNAT family N-acetyltransferase [Acetobacteraceae bacterium]
MPAPAAFAIRLMSEADRDALREHVAALNAYEQPFSGDRDLTPAGTERSLAHILSRVADTGGATWVAEVKGRVIGHLCLILETMPPFVAPDQARIAYVSDAFVREPMRGRGVFRALLAEAERFAIAAGATRIMIGVLAGNALAEGAYRRAGFRPYALEMVKDLPRP